jgi:hypothetical protein
MDMGIDETREKSLPSAIDRQGLRRNLPRGTLDHFLDTISLYDDGAVRDRIGSRAVNDNRVR